MHILLRCNDTEIVMFIPHADWSFLRQRRCCRRCRRASCAGTASSIWCDPQDVVQMARRLNF